MGVPGGPRLSAHPRFEIRRKLGAGACGAVFEAFDRERGATVALKTLERAEPAQLYRFKREFRELAGVVHPRLVTLYELVSADDVWFFTMELVPGTDFLTYVRGDRTPPAPETAATRREPRRGSEDPTEDLPARRKPAASGLDSAGLERLCAAMLQLAEGVRSLHRAGQIHRDLKPSNVRVRPTGGVVILDFGLIKPLRPGGRNQTLAIAGTPGYMAPEQATAGPLSEATDWYAVGAMLFQALVGELPHGSGTDAMISKQRVDAPPPSSLVDGVPRGLDQLCTALLRRDPTARPSGAEVIETLRALAPAEPATPDIRDESTPFVGRRHELAALLDAYDATADGTPRVAWVTGPSGIGKSTLVARLLDDIRTHAPDAVLLEGRCYQQESLPYKGIDSAIDALTRFLAELPDAEVAAYVPRHASALTRLFPVLESVDALHRAPERGTLAEGVELRRRAFSALRDMLGRIATRRPLVCCIDDLQWGDEDSGVLLSELLQPPDAPAMLLIGTYRSDEAGHSPLLRRLERALGALGDPPLTIELGGLAPDESRELASVLAGDDLDTDRIQRVVDEGRGSPMFINELARHLATADAGSPADSLDDVVRERVHRLPDAARALLEITAIAGFPTRPEAVAAAAGLDAADEQHTIALLCSERLVRHRVHSDRALVEPYHDRIREAVRDGLDEHTRRRHHRALANALERWGARYAEQLAYHLLAAGDQQGAAVYARRGAERAASSLAFDRAARLYGIAVDCADLTTHDGLELLIALAEACSNAGLGKESGDAYLRASRQASGELALRLQRQAAAQLMMSGHVQEGLNAIRDVLDANGFRLPESRPAAIASLLWNTTAVRIRTRSLRLRPPSEVDPTALDRVDACLTVSHGMAGVTPLLSAAFAARSANLALAAGEPSRVAVTLSMHAGLSAALSGRYPRGLRTIIKRAVDAAEDPYTRAFAHGMDGAASYLTSDLAGALRKCSEAEAWFRDECRGVAWEITSMQVLSSFSRSQLGHWRELSRLLPAQVREAEQRGDLFGAASLTMGNGYIPRLSAGEPDEFEREVDEYARRWGVAQMHYQHFYEALSRFYIALYRGDGAAAWDSLARRKQRLEKAGHFRVAITNTLWLWYEGTASLTLAADASERERERWLRIVAANVKRLRRLDTPMARHAADGLAALASVWRGRPGAVDALQSCEAGFAEDGRMLYVASVQRCRGLLLGGDEGSALIADADRRLRDEGIRDPERIASMICPRPPRSAV